MSNLDYSGTLKQHNIKMCLSKYNLCVMVNFIFNRNGKIQLLIKHLDGPNLKNIFLLFLNVQINLTDLEKQVDLVSKIKLM